jgi:hypothetical protein
MCVTVQYEKARLPVLFAEPLPCGALMPDHALTLAGSSIVR